MPLTKTPNQARCTQTPKGASGAKMLAFGQPPSHVTNRGEMFQFDTARYRPRHYPGLTSRPHLQRRGLRHEAGPVQPGKLGLRRLVALVRRALVPAPRRLDVGWDPEPQREKVAERGLRLSHPLE